MDEDMLADQRQLVALLEAEGWDVTDVELTAYDSPWADTDDLEATVTITGRKRYDEPEADDDETGENSFRVR